MMPFVVGLVIAIVAGAGWFTLRELRVRVRKSIVSGMPREQLKRFETRLRDTVFRDPFAAMKSLFSDGREAYVRTLWKESKPPKQGPGFDPGLSANGMFVFRTRLRDGRAIAVIGLPPAERIGEPQRVAVVLPQDKSLRDDIAAARKQVRFFVLNSSRPETGRETDLCGWTADGRRRDYNVGAPLDPEPFAAAVGDVLRGLRQ